MPSGFRIVILKTMEKYAHDVSVPEANDLAVANAVQNRTAKDGVQQHSDPQLQLQQNAQIKQMKRTPGLRLYDTLLYPLLNNFAVFAISVGATYLTARGGDRTPGGALKYGKIGAWFQQRGDWIVKQFKKTGMNDESAYMARTVFFSFADGSLMAPFIKGLEDNREKFAKGLDDMMGTRPADDSVYEAEPKQTWGSVLAGRALTAGIVVPTAMALDKTGLNKKLFTEPGIKLGQWIKDRPHIAKKFGSLDIGELSKVSFFEAFYTSVCTAGLYITSRYLAPKPKPKLHAAPVAAPVNDAPALPVQAATPPEVAMPEVSTTPAPKIQAQSTALEANRLAGNPSLALQGS